MIIDIEKNQKNNNEGETVTIEGGYDGDKNTSKVKFNVPPVSTDIAIAHTFKESFSDNAMMTGRRGGKDINNKAPRYKVTATSQKGIPLEKERIFTTSQPTNKPKMKLLERESNADHHDNADFNSICIENSVTEGHDQHILNARLPTPVAHNSDPLNGNEVRSHESFVQKKLIKTPCPGAVSVSSEGLCVPVHSFTASFECDDTAQLPLNIEAIDIENPQSYNPPLHAYLVVDSCELAQITVTILDIETEGKDLQKNQIRTILITFTTAIIVAFVFQLGYICMV